MPWSRRDDDPPLGPIDPTALVPVTAEDVARRKRRIIGSCLAVAVLVAVAAAWIHKRSTEPLRAQEEFDAGVS